MKNKVLGFLMALGNYLLRKVLVFVLGVVALVMLSFLVWKGLTPAALSERLVWTGIGLGMVAGFLVFGQTVGGRNFGTTTYTAAQSSTLIDWNIEIRQDIERRFDFRFQIFLVGAFTFLIGVLVDVIGK